MRHSMISTVKRHAAIHVLWCYLAVTLTLAAGVGELSAQDSWRQLPMPSMYLQLWGRPGMKDATWVVPQDSGVVGVSRNSGAMIVHRHVDPWLRKLTHAAAVDDDVAVVGGNDGAMFRTADGGETWQAVSWGGTRIRSMMTTRRGTIIVVIDGADYMYRSTDGGKTFVDDDSNLPFPIDRILAGRTGDTLYAVGGQSIGLFFSTNDGASWRGPLRSNSGILRDATIGNDGTLAIIDDRGQIWTRDGSPDSWSRMDPTFPLGEWDAISYASKDTMVLMRRAGAGRQMTVAQAVRKACPPGGTCWTISPIRINPEWLIGARACATSQGMLLSGDQATILTGWDGMVTTLCDPQDAYRRDASRGSALTGFESGPSGEAFAIGETWRWYDGWATDGFLSWIVRYEGERIEREVIIHSVANGDGAIDRMARLATISNYSPGITGFPMFYCGTTSYQYIYSRDAGRTWILSPKVLNQAVSFGPSLTSVLDTSTWLSGRAVMKAGTTDELTLYVSKDEGVSWDSVLITADLPIEPVNYDLPVEVHAYAPGRLLAYVLREDSLLDSNYLMDIDGNHRSAQTLPDRPYRGVWAVLKGRYLLNTYQVGTAAVVQDDTIHIEVYDLDRHTKISDVVMPSSSACFRHMGLTVWNDSMALVSGSCTTSFLTLDAGRTWQAYNLPDVDSAYLWYTWVVRRIRPGVFMAGARGTMKADVKRRREVVVAFHPEWDPIPLSVESSSGFSSSSSLTISPNPSPGLVAIDIPEDMDGPCSWHVVDMLGRVVAEGMADTMWGRQITPGRSLSSGGYTFVLQSHVGRRTARFVVQP